MGGSSKLMAVEDRLVVLQAQMDHDLSYSESSNYKIIAI
jgi:hypothetical protein